ncbi:SulP family inorganic anion transporter [Amphiplicatus metriothermophilus]|uniref:Sulfate permease, SulP family n=1 Tax=Amphiplicatus metriothermophilus TaxID=1519374 RepID=A0A239PY98_9PROT|nr:sulfate permease [Amphiplicatus metriothermophilus]MBB5519764.1 SulP family sulfate permease [Amphiplicatus metriothermophilus]SNT75235.1 sulfate permease, SulP family [Amphiplicatus metriothermophilus]
MLLRRYLPFLEWARSYDRATLASDLLAAAIVTIMLIPQSLAYALLAGLPPQVGLYASMAPLVAYALFGTSRALAVGPVAVISLMTAAAIGRVAEPGSSDYISAALALAVLSGLILLALGLFRLGALANFLSHPVISGFIFASSLLIAASQLKHILGVDADGHTLVEIAPALAARIADADALTLLIGLASLAFLFWARTGLKPLLVTVGIGPRSADLLSRLGPIAAVVAAIGATTLFDLDATGVAVVGAIPHGLPPLTPPRIEPQLWAQLAGPAALISIIGFVESVSVAQTLAAKKRQRIDSDQELIALGASNLAAGFTGGYPVTGGFARSVVNFDAGARTPAASAFTAAGILLAALYLTPFLQRLPQATLAATIIVAVLSLVDARALGRVWRYSKSDFAAMAATIGGTLSFGVEAGVLAGVILSLVLHIRRTSYPHTAVVGQAPGTEHFRNMERHKVVVSPEVLTLRVDESLYFANARYLEDRIYKLIAERPTVKHFVLMCPAVNEIDASGLEALESINERLKDAGVTFHLSEVKGPVMDRLQRSHFLERLTGRVFLTQFGAMSILAPELTRRTLTAKPEPQFLAERKGLVR